MAFPASTVSAEQAWDTIRRGAVRLSGTVTALRNASAAGDTEVPRYVQLHRLLVETIDEWDAVSSTPGLQAYARDQIDNQALDLAAEFTAMRNAAIALRDWIFTNLPTDSVTGAVAQYIVDAQSAVTSVTVSTAQTATFRTNADALLTTIG